MAFGSSIDLMTLDGRTGVRLVGLTISDYSTVKGAIGGDVNGDGYADLAIGLPSASPSGKVFVVFGHAGAWGASLDLRGLGGPSGVRFDGAAGSTYAGSSVAIADDLNGDGVDDVLIGASGASTTDFFDTRWTGAILGVFGQKAAWAAPVDLSALDGRNGFRLHGQGSWDVVGGSVTQVGDLNADGFSDLAASTFAMGRYQTGPGTIVFGRSLNWSANQLLSSAGIEIKAVPTLTTPQLMGITAAGDVNGDGLADLLIVAEASAPRPGGSYVLFGKAGGWTSPIDLETLDGSNGFRLQAPGLPVSYRPVTAAGDVNGDGFGDVVIGAPNSRFHGNWDGSAYVLFGRAGGWSASVDLGALDGNNGLRLDGAAPFSGTGNFVASAGDVNGDGYSDLLIGGSVAADENPYQPVTHLVFGKPDGWGAVTNLATLDASQALRFEGARRAAIGNGRASASDINGDGFDDVLFFRPDSPLTSESAAAYLWFSPASGGSVRFGTTLADRLRGGPGKDTLTGLSGHDTLYGGAGDDTLNAGPGRNTVYGETGRDTLVIEAGRGAGVLVLGPEPDAPGQSVRGSYTDARESSLFTSIEAIRFTDGRLVFDPADATLQAARLYRTAFDRAPDADGLAFWTALLRAGVPLAEVARGFAASDEFRAGLAALDDAAFVTRLYDNMLGRAPDPAALRDWTNALAAGAGRESVLLALAESAEFQAQYQADHANGFWQTDGAAAAIARLYQATLDRRPDADGLAAWRAELEAGRSMQHVSQGFIDSAEFTAAHGTLSDRAFVMLLYDNALARTAEAAGLEHWVGMLESGLARAAVVLGVSQSLESQQLNAAWIDGGILFA